VPRGAGPLDEPSLFPFLCALERLCEGEDSGAGSFGRI
jgi:hypothetical protein